MSKSLESRYLNNEAKTFLKWAGGEAQLLEELISRFPNRLKEIKLIVLLRAQKTDLITMSKLDWRDIIHCLEINYV